MKNIILQHWTGKVPEIVELSTKNIQHYANSLNVEYQFLRGNVFRDNLAFDPPMQKLYMLDPTFDDYDTVVMVDADMFTRKGMTQNIFDVWGIGMHSPFQDKIFRKIQAFAPTLTNSNYPFWGGAVWKLDKPTRQVLRKHINEKELRIFGKKFHDEGYMHRLATLAKIPMKDAYLPGPKMWCHGSYEPGIEKACFIHIRRLYKVDANTMDRRAKIINYTELVRKGIISA